MYNLDIKIENYKFLIRKIASKFSVFYDIEDLIQEGYIGLLKSRRSFNFQTKFSTYGYRAIYWEISNFCKKQQKISMLSKHKNTRNIGISQHILEILDEDEIKIINLYYVQNYSMQEIADKLNINKSTVSRKYNKIIKKLKDELTT